MPALSAVLADGGQAILELGAGQDGDVTAIAVASGLAVVARRPDLLGIPRALVLARS